MIVSIFLSQMMHNYSSIVEYLNAIQSFITLFAGWVFKSLRLCKGHWDKLQFTSVGRLPTE
jgi:hypothetical protein